jgi:phosphate transport system substrate-binding protein
MKVSIATTVLLLSTAALTLVGCSHKQSGAITIDGSDTVYPLSKAMVDAFQQRNPGVRITTQFSGTGGGFRKFCAGHIDIQGASRPIKLTEGAQCKSNHVEYIELPVAFDSLSVVVNPKNTFVDCLTVQELKTIWEPAAEGKINNWHQVRASFPSQPLVLFGPGRDSGTFDYFTLAIVGSESNSRDDYTKSTDYTVVARGVESDPNALGYFGYAYYKANMDKLRPVAIDSGHGCVQPSPQTVAHNTYQPLSRPLLLYVSVAASPRTEVREFIQLYLSMNSAGTVSKVGYVPLPPAALSVQNMRFENGVTGSALGGHGSVIDIVYGWFNTDAEEKAKAQFVQQ